MFAIKKTTSSEFIPLPQGFVFPLQWKSPHLIDGDNFAGSYSFPVNLMRTPEVWKEFDFPDNPNVVTTNKKIFDVDLLVAQAMHLQPKLQIINATNKRAEANVYENIFADDPGFADKKISEIYAEDIELATAIAVTVEFDASGMSTSAGDKDFWIDGTQYTYTASGAESVNDILIEIRDLINGASTRVVASVSGDVLTCTQVETGAELTLDVEKVYTNTIFGVSPNIYPGVGSVLGEDILDAMLDAANGTVDDYAYTFFPVHNENFYGGENSDYLGYMNYYHQGDTVQRFLRHGDAYTPMDDPPDWPNSFPIVPFIYVKKVWDKIFEGKSVSGDLPTREGFKQLVFFNTKSLDLSFDIVTTDGRQKICYNNNTFNTADHIPDMTVTEFLQSIKVIFNRSYDYDAKTNTVIVSERNEVPEIKAIKDWRSKLYEEMRFENTYRNGFTLTSTQDGGDEYSGIYYLQEEDYVYGEGMEKIPCAMSWPNVEQEISPSTNTHPGDEYDYWKVPIVKQAGTSKAFNVYNEFSPRILFYRGMQASYGDDSNNDYPFATNDSYDVEHSFEDGATGENSFDLTLMWHKLYEAHYSNWFPFYDNTVSLEGIITFQIDDLMTLDFDTFYRFENSNFLVDELEITETAGSDILCRVKMLSKLSTPP